MKNAFFEMLGSAPFVTAGFAFAYAMTMFSGVGTPDTIRYQIMAYVCVLLFIFLVYYFFGKKKEDKKIDVFKALRKWVRSYMGLPPIELQEEVEPYMKHLKGIVLNAGAGLRPLSTGLPTITCDFDEAAPVDFLADLHYIPLQDECVDSVISVAVLEHTRFPWECARELYRVLKPGGTAVICVPFLQPEHAVPHDFFRYTVYGLQSLLEWSGFVVERVERVSRFHRLLGWLIMEKVKESRKLTRVLAYPFAHIVAARAKTNGSPDSLYTGSYAVAHKPGNSVVSKPTGKNWFYPFLVDPVTKKNLGFGHVGLGVDVKLDLRPRDGLSQDSTRKWK